MEYQIDIASAQKVYCPQNSILAQQTAARIGVPNKANNFSIFDNLNVRKHFVGFDGVRCPRDALLPIIHQMAISIIIEVLVYFYTECVGEELLGHFTKYADMKIIYPNQVIDSKFQVDPDIPKKFQLHEKYRSATNNAGLLLILIRHREIKLISDGNEITEFTIIENENT